MQNFTYGTVSHLDLMNAYSYSSFTRSTTSPFRLRANFHTTLMMALGSFLYMALIALSTLSVPQKEWFSTELSLHPWPSEATSMPLTRRPCTSEGASPLVPRTPKLKTCSGSTSLPMTWGADPPRPTVAAVPFAKMSESASRGKIHAAPGSSRRTGCQAVMMRPPRSCTASAVSGRSVRSTTKTSAASPPTAGRTRSPTRTSRAGLREPSAMVTRQPPSKQPPAGLYRLASAAWLTAARIGPPPPPAAFGGAAAAAAFAASSSAARKFVAASA